MRNSVKRWLINYYIALQLGAGAATQVSFVSFEDGPAPIVGPYFDAQRQAWDPREIVHSSAGSAVVTVPVRPDAAQAASSWWLN